MSFHPMNTSMKRNLISKTISSRWPWGFRWLLEGEQIDKLYILLSNIRLLGTFQSIPGGHKRIKTHNCLRRGGGRNAFISMRCNKRRY